MRISPPPLEIGDTEGFAPEKDIFNRRELGTGLTNLVRVISDPMVIAIDAQWGSGKTIFLKMWAGELRKAGFPVVYFDAFENDYLEDAFSAIAGQIIALAQDKKKEGEPAAKRFVSKAFGAGRVLLRSSLKVAVKVGSAGALDAAGIAEELGDAVKDISSEAKDIEDKYLGEILTKQREKKDTIQAFRDALSELPALLAEAPASGELSSRPLIFIVDELDRCRPVFALQVLERLKHFFSVQNVHFVLAVHGGQLRNSVASAYGGQIDALAYLQKFIHLTIPLTDDSVHEHERIALRFTGYLKQKLDFAAPDRDLVEYVADVLAYVAHHNGLSLRAIERIMTSLAVALAYTTDNQLRPGPIIAGLCIIRIVAPEAYARAKKGRLTYGEVCEILSLQTRPGEQESFDVLWFLSWWQFALDPDAPLI